MAGAMARPSHAALMRDPAYVQPESGAHMLKLVESGFGMSSLEVTKLQTRKKTLRTHQNTDPIANNMISMGIGILFRPLH